MSNRQKLGRRAALRLYENNILTPLTLHDDIPVELVSLLESIRALAVENTIASVLGGKDSEADEGADCLLWIKNTENDLEALGFPSTSSPIEVSYAYCG